MTTEQEGGGSPLPDSRPLLTARGLYEMWADAVKEEGLHAPKWEDLVEPSHACWVRFATNVRHFFRP